MTVHLYRFWYFLLYLGRRYFDDRCASIASALTFSGLLAIVPLMTIGYALLSGFPSFQEAEQQLQALVFRNLLPEVGTAVLSHITNFTAAAGRLTVYGLVGLAVSAILLFFTVEGALNAIFRVRRERPVFARILIFWAGLTLMPLLLTATVSLSGGMHDILERVGLGQVTLLGNSILSQILLTIVEALVFMIFYRLVPNRPVRLRDALAGAVLAAILLEISKAGFAAYVSGSSVYQTIYGALSLIPTVLLWVYITSSTLLIGAELTAALPEWRAGYGRAEARRGLKPPERLGAALLVLDALVGAQTKGHSLKIRRLENKVQLTGPWLDDTLSDLAQARLIAEAADSGWLLSRNLSEVSLYELREALGLGAAGLAMPGGGTPPWLARFTSLIETADSNDRSLLSVTVAEILAKTDS